MKEIDWDRVRDELDAHGASVIEKAISADECNGLAALYPVERHFRSRVVMARHGFGRGEYKYFGYPLPDLIGRLRTALYPRLATVANRWNTAMGIRERFPERHSAFIRRCHAAGQRRPTPLLLQYGAGDYNCLHQDLYGEHVFPLQLTLRRGRASREGRRGDLRGSQPPGAGHARRLSRKAAPWREPRALGPPAYGRHHLSRRRMKL